MEVPSKFKPVLTFLWVYAALSVVAFMGMVAGTDWGYTWSIISYYTMWPVFIFAGIYYLVTLSEEKQWP